MSSAVAVAIKSSRVVYWPSIDTLVIVGALLLLPTRISWVVNQALSSSPSLILIFACHISPSLIATDGICKSPSKAETLDPSTYHSTPLTDRLSPSASNSIQSIDKLSVSTAGEGLISAELINGIEFTINRLSE